MSCCCCCSGNRVGQAPTFQDVASSPDQTENVNGVALDALSSIELSSRGSLSSQTHSHTSSNALNSARDSRRRNRAPDLSREVGQVDLAPEAPSSEDAETINGMAHHTTLSANELSSRGSLSDQIHSEESGSSSNFERDNGQVNMTPAPSRKRSASDSDRSWKRGISAFTPSSHDSSQSVYSENSAGSAQDELLPSFKQVKRFPHAFSQISENPTHNTGSAPPPPY